jgi:hypothetical protein
MSARSMEEVEGMADRVLLSISTPSRLGKRGSTARD